MRWAALWLALAAGFPQDWEAQTAAAIRLVHQQRYGEAEQLYLAAIPGLKAVPLATTLNDLGMVYRIQGRYREAERCYRQSAELFEKHAGPRSAERATVLANLAELYRRQRLFRQAEETFSRALSIRQWPIALDGLAAVYQEEGRLADAGTAYEQARALLAKSDDQAEVAVNLNGLGVLRHAQRRDQEAEPLLRRALSIREALLGADHPDVASTLNNLAAVYYSQRRYDETEALMRRALAIRQQAGHVEPLETARFLANYAEVLRKLGRAKEAAGVESQARSIAASEDPGRFRVDVRDPAARRSKGK